MNKGNSRPDNGRRRFLKTAGGTALAGIAAGTAGIPALSRSASAKEQSETRARAGGSARADAAFQKRVAAAQRQFDNTSTSHPSNGDESRYANFIGSFSKALPHNALGEVDPSAYAALTAAAASGISTDFDSIPLGGTVKLTNPQAGHSFQIEGSDSHGLTMPPAPALSSIVESAEILEVYWQALTRDVPFEEYPKNAAVSTAVRELGRFPIFRGVTADSLFRGNTPGDRVGPYLSQFLLKPIPYGTNLIDQQYAVPVAGDDHMTDYAEWLNIQNGAQPAGAAVFDPTPRYIRNSRDLAEYVHRDTPFQPYHSAAMIMLGWGGAAVGASNPYLASANQAGFVSFGVPHILDFVSRAALAALKAAWFQKWNVHRRLRPEEFAGIIHNQLTGGTNHPINIYINGSAALASVFKMHGTYLLPMAYPEGCPTHPAYPAGHATVAGACATVLKAFFREDFVIPDPVVPAQDGTSLEPYTGPQLTIGGEANKLAANISLGRDAAGVHWRSDGIEGMRLGEKVAISLLSDYTETYCEDFAGFTFTKFDGSTVTV